MNKVKKIIILLSLIMLIGSMFAGKTYAALNCNVNLSKPKDKFTYEEEFSVYVSISNLQTTKGIIAIGAVLSYDKESLELVDIEGENKWSAPSYSTSNGKMTSFKNKLSTSNENVFKIIFKVNEKGKAKDSAWIKISDFEISDGDEEKNCGGSSINIAIGETSGGNSGNNNQGGSSNNNQSGSSSGSSTTKKPSTGNTTKKPSSSSTNKNDKDTNNTGTSSNNNIEQNTIENVIDDEVINNNIIEDNNIVDNLEENKITSEEEETKKIDKGQFYMVSLITIVAIIAILLIIKKFWKTEK